MNERVLEFIGYLNISVAEFERNCELSNGAVSKMGDNTRTSTIDKISNRYPDLNTTWLRTGEGEMLKSGAVVGGNGIAVSGNNVKTGSVSVVGGEAAALKEKVKMMQTLLEEKDKLIEEKERLIKVLMERG